MNIRYKYGDEVVWAPAEHTDAVFQSLIGLYERRHQSIAGIDWSVDGEAHIDAASLATFSQGVMNEWESVGSTTFHVLVDGFVAMLQVICERCGIELDVSDRAYALGVSMRHNM